MDLVGSKLLDMGICDSAEAAAVSGHLGPPPRPSKMVGILEQIGLWLRSELAVLRVCHLLLIFRQVRQLMNCRGCFSTVLLRCLCSFFALLPHFLGGIILTCKAVLELKLESSMWVWFTWCLNHLYSTHIYVCCMPTSCKIIAAVPVMVRSASLLLGHSITHML